VGSKLGFFFLVLLRMRSNVLRAVLLSVCVVHCIAAHSYSAAPLASCNRLRRPPPLKSCDLPSERENAK
jgi:hypothetical protein